MLRYDEKNVEGECFADEVFGALDLDQYRKSFLVRVAFLLGLIRRFQTSS